MTTREKFVAEFGGIDAALVEKVARGHRSIAESDPDVGLSNAFMAVLGGMLGRNTVFGPHEDQFLVDLSTCISYDCLWEYHSDHGFVSDREKMRDWIRGNVRIPKEIRDASTTYEEYLGEESPVEQQQNGGGDCKQP